MFRKKTKFYKGTLVLLVLILFLSVVVFPSQPALAQEVNYCLDGTPSFVYTGADPGHCGGCYYGIGWQTNADYINDDITSNYVGVCSGDPWGTYYGTYTATVNFDSTKAQVDKVEYISWGYAYGQYGTLTASLYYAGSWHDIDSRSVNMGGDSPNPQTVEITSGGPWYNVESVRVHANLLTSEYYCVVSYIYEIQAFGPAAPSFQDIGLRVQAPSGTVSIAAEIGAPTSPLRIAKNGVIYGIALVDPGDPNDSGVRIQTSSGIKALRRL